MEVDLDNEETLNTYENYMMVLFTFVLGNARLAIVNTPIDLEADDELDDELRKHQ